MMLMLDFTCGLVSNQALSILAVANLAGATAALGKCCVICGNKLASNPTFQIRAFDLCFVLPKGCMYVVAVHNTGSAVLLWGTFSATHYHAMTVLDDGLPARAGKSVENFPLFTTNEHLRVAMSVKTQVHLAHSAVSIYDHKQLPREVGKESKCI